MTERLKTRNQYLANTRDPKLGTIGTGSGVTRFLSDAEARELVRAAQQYNDHALSRIYQLFSDRIFRYIFYRIGERARADDLTAEVFVRMLEKIAQFRFGPNGHALAFTGWMYRIAHNLVVDEYRQRQSQGEMDSLPEDWEADAQDTELPEDFQLTRADLQLALRQLTDEQQTVIVLRFSDGMTSAEIAQMLGKTEMAIKALQRRGLAALARQLSTETELEKARDNS